MMHLIQRQESWCSHNVTPETENKEYDTYGSEPFGNRNGQPCTRNTPHEGKYDKAEHQEDVSTKGGEDSSPGAALDALEIAYHGDVDGKEEQVNGKKGHTLDSEGMRGGIVLNEKAHQRVGEEDDKGGHHHTAHNSYSKHQTQGVAHTLPATGTIVVADDGLGRLSDGVVDHEKERTAVASDAVGSHAALAEQTTEDIVAQHEHERDGYLAKETGEAQLHLLPRRLQPSCTPAESGS